MRVFLFGKKLEANNTRHVLKEADKMLLEIWSVSDKNQYTG